MPETHPGLEDVLRHLTPIGAGQPTTIGGYRILGVLGVGGMGTVYAAEQDQPRRIVALKVIRSEYASDDALRRFARESEVLGRLQHPGIANIYAAGQAEGPYGAQPFFAMELVHGLSLTDYAKADGIGTAKRLDLFARICDAVQYAHQRGVIHRDLKPANILVDDAGQPKILDFGVARLTEGDRPGTLKTEIGVVVGTLQYMSPEQIGGDPLDIDTRSDIYALGVILYELLSGQLPYSWKSGIAQAAHVISTTEPATLGSIDRRFRGDVETIVAKALEKDKARRYDSAAALASDVRKHLRDEPISARPASAIYQMRKLARRHRALFAGLGIAAAALVVGTVVSLVMAVRAGTAGRLAETRGNEAIAASALAEQRRGEAEAGRIAADSARNAAVRERAAAIASSKRAEAEAAKAIAANGFLQNMLQSSNPDLTQGANITIKDVVDRAGRDLAAGRLADQPTVRADVHVTLGRTYAAVAAYDSALAHFDSAVALRQRTLGVNNVATLEAALDAAVVVSEKRDVPAAKQRFRSILDAARRVRPPRPDLIVETTRRLALLAQIEQHDAEADSVGSAALAYARQAKVTDTVLIGAVQTLAEIRTYANHAKEAEPLWREAVDFDRQRYGERHTTTLSAGSGLAYNLYLQARYRESEDLLRPMLPIMRSVYGEHPLVANVLNWLGTGLDRQGRREEAEPFLRESLAIRLKVLGDQHPDVQLVRVGLARLLQASGRYAAAESLYTDALRARIAVFGPTHGGVASTMDDLAGLATARGDYPEAARRYREVIPVWRDAKLPQWEQVAVSRLASVLTAQNELDEAERLLVEVLPKQRALLGDTHIELAATLYRLAEVARRRGRLAQADSIHKETLAMRRRLYGPASISLAGSLEALATVREQMGDTASAEPYLREVVEITRTVRPLSDPTLLQRENRLATTLCATGQAKDGEKMARDVLAATAATDSTRLARARKTLDVCLSKGRP